MKLLKLFIIFTTTALLLFAIFWNFVDTYPPKDWSYIKVGMTRRDVYKCIGVSDENILYMGNNDVFDTHDIIHNLKNYSKYRSKYSWELIIEYSDGVNELITGCRVNEEMRSAARGIRHLDDKIIKVSIKKEQESWFEWFPYPRITQIHHS